MVQPLPEKSEPEPKPEITSKSPLKTVGAVPVLAHELAFVPNESRLHEINTESAMSPEKQISIKKSMHKIVDATAVGEVPDPLVYTAARDEIVAEVLGSVDEVSHLNQLRVFDDYDYSHGINVSILSVMLGYKLHITSSMLKTLALGALLHEYRQNQDP